jgi:rhamnulokinase
MAARYAEVLAAIGKITGKKLKRLFIVGGGNQNTLLNGLTAQRTGLEILLGSTESSTIGNFSVQLAALEQNKNAQSAINLASVVKWAEHLSAIPLAPFTDRETD